MSEEFNSADPGFPNVSIFGFLRVVKQHVSWFAASYVPDERGDFERNFLKILWAYTVNYYDGGRYECEDERRG